MIATFAPDLISYTSARFGKDALASLTVFLVALPLCLGIAIASGAPPAAGIVTGIVGGLVVGTLTGSPLQVSGPAAGLAVLVWEMIQSHGLEMLGPIVLLAGAIQVAAGLLGLGQWFRAVSPAVIKGMLAGIGVLIFAAQFHVMVDDTPQGSGIANLLSIPSAIWKAATPRSDLPHAEAAAIGLLTIFTIVVWGWLVGRTNRPRLRSVPAPLVGVVVATVAATAFRLPIRYVAVPDSLFDALVAPTWSLLGGALEGSLLVAAVAMAFVASAETLLCATATDQMHGGRVPTTRYDRELWTQGVGNVVCGALGALPMTGVIVRSSANVQAGAMSRVSTIMHGAWLLLLVVGFPGVLRFIPVASLAGVLVFTGYKLVDPKAIRSFWALGWAEFGIYATTLATIVVKNLLTGVIVGIVLAAIKLLYTFSHLDVRLRKEGRGGGTTLHLDGAATFVRLPKLAAALERVPATTELHVRLEDLSYIDHACLDLLMNWEKQHEATGGRLVVDWETLHARFRSERSARPSTMRSGGLTTMAESPLDGGWRPSAVFVACSDALGDPGIIMQSESDDLFVVRNAGNIIPPAGAPPCGELASVEYAVTVLGVRRLVVCGHSDCGAMQAVLDPPAPSAVPNVSAWLAHAAASTEVDGPAPDARSTRLDRMSEANVRVQLRHLMTHPFVATRVASGALQIEGWVYDVDTGAIRAYRASTGTFEQIDGAHAGAS